MRWEPMAGPVTSTSYVRSAIESPARPSKRPRPFASIGVVAPAFLSTCQDPSSSNSPMPARCTHCRSEAVPVAGTPSRNTANSITSPATLPTAAATAGGSGVTTSVARTRSSVSSTLAGAATGAIATNANRSS